MSTRYLTAGTRIKVSTKIKNDAGEFANPSTVFMRSHVVTDADPVGVSVDTAMTADSVGHFHADFLVDVAGEWTFEVHGIGGIDVVSDKSLTVTASAALPAP